MGILACGVGGAHSRMSKLAHHVSNRAPSACTQKSTPQPLRPAATRPPSGCDAARGRRSKVLWPPTPELLGLCTAPPLALRNGFILYTLYLILYTGPLSRSAPASPTTPARTSLALPAARAAEHVPPSTPPTPRPRRAAHCALLAVRHGRLASTSDEPQAARRSRREKERFHAPESGPAATPPFSLSR